jgi:hypothetical protein
VSTKREARYIDAADTAKLVRAALKRAFPRVRFGVRTSRYAGGASVQVRWTDGPTTAAVETIVQPYTGREFDAMIDMETRRDAWLLPDGSVRPARMHGTEGAGGTIVEDRRGIPHDDAELVHFGAGYISANRLHSRALVERIAAEVACLLRKPVPAIRESDGAAYVEGDARLADAIRRALEETEVAP